MELARGLSLKATGWVLAGSQRKSLGRSNLPAALWAGGACWAGKEPCPREKGLLGPGGGSTPKADSGTLGGVALLVGISEVQCVGDLPGMSLGRTRKTSQKEES